MIEREALGPLDVGRSDVAGQAGRRINDHVRLLSDPIWDGEQWRVVADVDGMLCLLAVNIYAERSRA